MPENEEAWDLWKAAGTQWRASGFSVIGLDYPAVFKIAEVSGFEITPALRYKLQVLESATLKKIKEAKK